MDRTKTSKAKVKSPTQTQKARLYDLETLGDIEVVKEGVVWAHTRAGEDTLIDLHKAGKAEFQRKRYPKRYDKDGNEIPEDKLKDYSAKDTKTVDEVKDIIAQKQKDKAIADLTKKLKAMTKAEIEKEYGVSSKLTKDKMIEAVIDKMFNEGE